MSDTSTERHVMSQQLFSTEVETLGFDLTAGKRWIYPENYSRREYQFQIVQTALYHNTLVCLPTGLGKTFIAAVVMYNFWRWYPKGRIVFLAPTKPLVAQQIIACHEIMGIPHEETIELTGTVHQNKRKVAWTQKRVIFATPQTFQKDLQNEIVPIDLIKCIVFDEAHKALGKYSYSEIVKLMIVKNKYFRILALSATPGSKIDQVKEVVQNLLIAELELRDDSSPDIVPYINERAINRLVIPLSSELAQYKERYINVMNPHVRKLISANILKMDAANISKGKIFYLMNMYKQKPDKSRNHNSILKTFTILLTMYHAYELLTSYGLRAFYNFYSHHTDKFWIDNETSLKELLVDIKEHIGDFPDANNISSDGTLKQIPDNLVFGHEKFNKLKEVLVNHFNMYQNQSKSTRAIVFVEYREIVHDVYVLLLQLKPLIRPQIFVGQAGQKQKEQLKAVEDFRNNKVNVLISTSVGEEGLDVGEVDLIICFDISSSSTRLVQRIGRTGRKRNGNVTLLVTEGQELKTLNQAMIKKDSLNSKVLQSSNISSSIYQENPRMIPSNIQPECCPIFIKVQEQVPKSAFTKKKAAAPKKSRKNINEVQNEIITEFETCPTDELSEPNSKNQPSLRKYFMQDRPKRKFEDLSTSTSEEFQSDKRCKNNNAVKISSVKLYFVDNDATEFLTLCTMKKSNPLEVYPLLQVDTTYILNSIEKDIFSEFAVPSMDVLECIKNLPTLKSLSCSEINEADDNSFINEHQKDMFESLIIEEINSRDYRKSKGLLPDCSTPTWKSNRAYNNDYENNYHPELPRSKFLTRSEDNEQDKIQSDSDTYYSSTGSKPCSPIIERSFVALLDEVTESESNDGDSIHRSISSRHSDISDAINTTSPALCDQNIIGNLLDIETDEEDTLHEMYDTKIDTDSAYDKTFTDNPSISRHLNFEVSNKRRATTPSEIPIAKKMKVQETNPEDSDDSDIVLIDFSGGASHPNNAINSDSKAVENKPDKDDSGNQGTQNYDSEDDIFDEFDSFSQKAKVNQLSMEKKIVNKNQLDRKSADITSVDTFFEENKNDLPNLEQEYPDSDETFYDASEIPIDPIEPCAIHNSTVLRDTSNVSIPKIENLAKTSNQNDIGILEDEDWSDFDDTASSRKYQDNQEFNDNTKLSTSCLPERKLDERINNTFQSSSSNDYHSKSVLNEKNINVKADKPKKKPGIKIISDKLINFDTSFDCFRVDGIENFRPREKIKSPKKRPKSGLNYEKLKKTCDNDGFAIPSNSKDLIFKPKGIDTFGDKMSLNHSHNKKKRFLDKNERKIKELKRLRKKTKNDFIVDEAEISSDACTTDGSSSDHSDNGDLGSFVSYTQDVTDAVDMKALYLQTSKSPVNGKFVFKKVEARVPNHELYSQPVTQTDNTYLYDSFCVNENESQLQYDSSVEEIDDVNSPVVSRKKARLSEKFRNKKLKSRKIDLNNEKSSSEDELENWRKQVMEESIFHKNK